MARETSSSYSSVNSSSGPAQESVDQVMKEFRSLAASFDELLASGGAGTEKLAQLRDQAAEKLRQAREVFGNFERGTLQRAKEVASKSDEYVHSNPWTAIGIGVGVGLLLGLLVSRR
jgi:ElaB/YqjD/DUF883 family membrane-anchored ribosome-binding protein